ncbi:MAG TPA: FadR/GntR family transcriptional regulator [Pseudonocardiaceae bacterium]|nr:FadR/GntR family transcriptional regulator [Pseudonocardiaceae bacterium]
MSVERHSSGPSPSAATWQLRLDPRHSLPEVIEEKLRELIDSGELPPGERLPNEPELARRMGVARSSVRTALQRLEVLGVAEVHRGRGWFVRRKPVVRQPDEFVEWLAERQFRLGELLEVRMALEGMATSLAAVRATDGELDDIAKLSKDHHGAHTDVEERVRSGEAFHGAIVRASRNDLLIATYHVLVPELAEFRRQIFTGPEQPLRWGTAHDHVVHFLKRRDPAGARAAMVNHLFELYDDIRATGEQRGSEPALHYPDIVGMDDEPDWHPR